MLEKIAQQNVQNTSNRYALQSKDTNINLVSLPMKPALSLVKYSSDNLKANYLPINQSHAKISFGSDVNAESHDLVVQRVYRFTENSGVKDMHVSSYLKEVNGNYYNETADNLAILLGPDKHAVMLTENGVEPELFIQRFTKNVEKGKYNGQGFNNYSTKVLYMDPEKVMSEKPDINSLLAGMSNSSKNQKTIVFVKDFDNSLKNLTLSGLNDFLVEKVPNLSLVGLISKKAYEKAKDEQTKRVSLIMNAPALEELLTPFVKLDLNGLNANEAKDFFAENPNYAQKVLQRYKNVNLKVSDNAMSAIVDKSSTIIEGAFPKKALDVLDLVAAAKLSESKAIQDKLYKSDLLIKTSDVEKFFDVHAGVVDVIKEKEGTFKLAQNVKERFSDIGGLSEEFREELNDNIIEFAKDPKKFLAKGGAAPNGQVFAGPPGTGKTLLAKVIAGESGSPFIAVSGSEFVEKYVGMGPKRVRELREKAVKAAQDSGKNVAFVFIDEVDAIAGKRDSNTHDERLATLNQLLTEMDGFNSKASKTKIIWMFATNRVDMVDPAFLSRCDEPVTIPNPRTKFDRIEVLSIHAKKLAFKNESEKTKVLEAAAHFTDGMSGREMKKMMDKVTNIVIKKPENKFVEHNDMVEGYLQAIAGRVNKRVEDSIEEVKKTIRHEGGHAVFTDMLKQDAISFITLDSRGDFLGAVFHHPTEHKSPNFRSVILSAARSYAGGLAEPNFDEVGHAAGVSGDLKNATNTIKNAVTRWGLGLNTPPVSFVNDADEISQDMLNLYSKEIKNDVDLFSTTAQKVAKMTVDFHSEFLDDYIALYEKNAGKGGNNLSGEEFSRLRQEWLVKTNRIEAEKQLLKDIDKVIDAAFNSNKKGIINTVKKVLKSVR